MGTYAADKVGSVLSSSCVGLFTPGWRGITAIGVFSVAGCVFGGVDMAVIWMGLELGALIRMCCDGARGKQLLLWGGIGSAQLSCDVCSICWVGRCIG